MIRHISASVISSLQMHYGESDEEDVDKKNTSRSNSTEDKPLISSEPNNENAKLSSENDKYNSSYNKDDEVPGNVKEELDDEERDEEIKQEELISDDEDAGHHHHRPHIKHLDLETSRKLAVMEAVKTESPSSQGSISGGRKATRLVSYGPDEDVEDEDSSESDEVDFTEDGTSASPEIDVDSSTLSRSVQNMSNDEIKIPSEPPGKCSNQLQKKIEDMYDRMRRDGFDLNRTIQSKKNFRNPSIYEKLVDFCRIDEKGTNFPPEIYDPHIWGKESFYDELDKVQRKDMERREKEKKTKIEFMTGTKKPASLSDSVLGVTDEKKRKTKWDAQPSQLIHVSKLPSANQNPGVVNLTAMATGTKATVISAVGSLSKKPSSGK